MKTTLAATSVIACIACSHEDALDFDPELLCDDLAAHMEGCGFAADRDECLARPELADLLLETDCDDVMAIATSASNEATSLIDINANDSWVTCIPIGETLEVSYTGIDDVQKTVSVTVNEPAGMGRCGPGADADGGWTMDCLIHDICIHEEYSWIGTDIFRNTIFGACADEMWNAWDDYWSSDAPAICFGGPYVGGIPAWQE